MNESIHADKAASLADLAVSTSSVDLNARSSEIEDAIAAGRMTAAAVFTRMRWLIRASVRETAMAEARLNDCEASHGRLAEALKACLPFIDDAEDVAQFFADSAATDKCRAAVAAARAALASIPKELA